MPRAPMDQLVWPESPGPMSSVAMEYRDFVSLHTVPANHGPYSNKRLIVYYMPTKQVRNDANALRACITMYTFLAMGDRHNEKRSRIVCLR